MQTKETKLEQFSGQWGRQQSKPERAASKEANKSIREQARILNVNKNWVGPGKKANSPVRQKEKLQLDTRDEDNSAKNEENTQTETYWRGTANRGEVNQIQLIKKAFV